MGDEAAKLLDAVQDWVRRNLGAEGGHIATGAPECAWCPVCQLITVLRGDRPEISEKVTDAAVSVLAALRNLVDAAAGSASAARPGQPRVRRIDLADSGEA